MEPIEIIVVTIKKLMIMKMEPGIKKLIITKTIISSNEYLKNKI